MKIQPTNDFMLSFLSAAVAVATTVAADIAVLYLFSVDKFSVVYEKQHSRPYHNIAQYKVKST